MVKLSERTELALKADISSILYENPLRALFTKEISIELRRDKEFTKKLLLGMEKEGLVESVVKISKDKYYKKRMKWKIPEKILKIYKESKNDF